MIRSMTAFAREESQLEWGRAWWEIRSVNHRYLEVNLRLPEELRGLDTRVRERISQHARRGKIDCNLRFEAGKGTDPRIQINQPLAEQILHAAKQIKSLAPDDLCAPSCMDILRWPGVLELPTLDLDALSSALLDELDKTLDHFIAHREREGRQLHNVLEARCQAIQEEVDAVRKFLPEILQTQRERLHKKLGEVLQNIDSERIEQEIVLFAQKMDVAEELERLETHLAEIRAALDHKTPVGRRLDFLMQELNREANTLGAKSVHARTSLAAVNLKVLIEQMREQVQNIE